MRCETDVPPFGGTIGVSAAFEEEDGIVPCGDTLWARCASRWGGGEGRGGVRGVRIIDDLLFQDVKYIIS
jgi:hypothetical protein